MPTLTAAKVKELDKPGAYGDGNGLYLNIAKGGSRSWIQKVTIDGNRVARGLGSVNTLTLAKARKLAADNQAALRAGHNPFERGAAAASPEPAEEREIPTFSQAAYIVLGLNADDWAPAVAKRWIARLRQHAFAAIGDRPVDQISRSNLAELLTPLRLDMHETERKVRQALAKVFRWVRAHDFRVDDPADDALLELLPKVRHVAKNREALHYSNVAAAIQKVRFGYALRITQSAFEFLILTAARTDEVRFATWDEIDLDAATWTIPASRMKAKRCHTVPLSEQAMAILRSLRHVPDPDAEPDSIFTLKEVTEGYIFTMPSGKTLSENALLDRCRKEELDCTPHGFRTSFRDWAKAEYRARFEAIELALAHAVGTSVTQAYDRDTLVEERAAIMQAWADYVSPDMSPF